MQIPCSCRNRHGTECQSEAAVQWRRRYAVRLPEVPTYHAVFTVPDSLRYVFRARPRQMHSLLFKSVRTTLQRFCPVIDDCKVRGVARSPCCIPGGEELQFQLEELYVPPSLRSRGIRTALVTALLERTRGDDVARLANAIQLGHCQNVA